MKLFECCKNCEHAVYHYGLVYCELGGIINFPRFMGGSHRCECYERWHRPKREKFQYPKKEIKK